MNCSSRTFSPQRSLSVTNNFVNCKLTCCNWLMTLLSKDSKCCATVHFENAWVARYLWHVKHFTRTSQMGNGLSNVLVTLAGNNDKPSPERFMHECSACQYSLMMVALCHWNVRKAVPNWLVCAKCLTSCGMKAPCLKFIRTYVCYHAKSCTVWCVLSVAERQ